MATSPQTPDLPVTLSDVLTYLAPAAQGGEALLSSAKVTGCGAGLCPGSVYLPYLSVDWTVRYSRLLWGHGPQSLLVCQGKEVSLLRYKKKCPPPAFSETFT